MNKKLLYLSVFVVLSCQIVLGVSPKRELRASWLTTVWMLDWPSVTVPKATGTNDAARQAAILQQKNDLIAILNSLKSANMNAAFFQIRGMCDAMYSSSYEPWSAYVSSERGANPGYDPLAFAIEEAHKRGMELHAWLNPYRYSSSSATYGSTALDYSNTHPGWILDYGSSVTILNPGLPEVVKQIKSIIGEVVNNYDVDGIIFDDYFYAYGGTSSTLDATTQALYKPAAQSVGDWRRENVNKMVAAVYDTIQKVKPYVRFGISPFGTWTTDQTVATQRGIQLPSGVGTTGNMYAEIYCDPVAWLQAGTVDYVSPQLYWTTDSSYPYGKLAPWWSELSNRFNRHFYSSHSLSSMATAPAQKLTLNNEQVVSTALSSIENSAVQRVQSTQNKVAEAANFASTEIGLQIDFNRSSDMNDAPGSVFYATKKAVAPSFISYLAANKFTQPALTPAIGWKKTVLLNGVDNLVLSGQALSWSYSGTNVRYAVYAVPVANRNDANIFASSAYLLGCSYSKDFTLPASINSGTHKIAVSVVDRYGNEFSPRFYGENLITSVATTLISPASNAKALIPCMFKWDAVTGADSYVWQVARDAQFSDLVCSRETPNPQFFSGLQTNLKDNTDYFWRVLTRKANAVDVWSDVYKFTSDKFGIISPANNAGGVSLAPTITWDSVSPTATYTVEISTALDFSTSKQVFKQTTNSNSVTLTAGILLSSTTYYLRVSVSDGIVQSTSETVVFTTQDIVIPVPQLTKPTNGAAVQGTSIEVCWESQASNGFRIELSKDPSFPVRGTTLKTVNANTYCASYDALNAATYYVRVRALTATGMTEPSASASVLLTANTPVSDAYLTNLRCFVRSNETENTRLIIQSPESFDATIQLFSLTGDAIFTFDANIISGENNFLLNNTKLSKGAYFLTIKSNMKLVSYKIIR